MQISLRHSGVDLGFVETAAKSIRRPRLPPTAGQDCGRALRDASKDFAECTVQRNDCLAAVPAFPGGEHSTSSPTCDHDNLIKSLSRKPVWPAKIDGVSNLGRTGFLNLSNIGLSPDDFGTIIVIKVA